MAYHFGKCDDEDSKTDIKRKSESGWCEPMRVDAV